MDTEKRKKRGRTLLKVLAWIAGIWAVILIIIQIALSSAVLTRLANNFAENYVDGDVSFGKVKLSVFKSFPNVNVSFDTVSVTYPSDRFASLEKKTGIHRVAGRGSGVDTLMSFDNFSASLNVAALAMGQVRIPSLTLEKPRIFARSYDKENSNWNILKLSGSPDQDTTSASMPKIVLGRIIFDRKPLIVYNQEDQPEG